MLLNSLGPRSLPRRRLAKRCLGRSDDLRISFQRNNKRSGGRPATEGSRQYLKIKVVPQICIGTAFRDAAPHRLPWLARAQVPEFSAVPSPRFLRYSLRPNVVLCSVA